MPFLISPHCSTHPWVRHNCCSIATALPIKRKCEEEEDAPECIRKFFRSISGILVVQQKFSSISTPATNLPALEFSVSDSRAYYLG